MTAGYIVAPVVSLHGLRHLLGLHVDPPVEQGQLVEFELFAEDVCSDYPASSDALFQQHLELAFGPPTRSSRSPSAT